MPPRKVLIVEDDAVGRQILFTALKNAGYQPALAPDAVAALSLTRQLQPAAIILDLGLPGGGGFVFLERLAMIPALSTIPVIIVSGQERAQSEARARASGAVAYFEKPVEPAAVVEAVRSIAGEPNG